MLAPNMTVQDVKRSLKEDFSKAGLESPALDASLLIMMATGMSRADLIAQAYQILPEDIIHQITALSVRRLSGEPIDHILGFKGFYGRKFKVTQDVLSPRPETEMLVDEALKYIRFKPDARILDLGTGSGAIIISILAEADKVTGTAADISKAALDIAAQNAKFHDVDDRLEFTLGRWFEGLDQQYDLIVSNPPYIDLGALEDLSLEVKNYDPHLALSGGADGLEAYRAIVKDAKSYLTKTGKILFETGFDQAIAVSELLSQAGFHNIHVDNDLAGHPRLIGADYS